MHCIISTLMFYFNEYLVHISYVIIIIIQHNIKQIKIITDEYKNMPEGCQRNKRSLNWPSILLYI